MVGGRGLEFEVILYSGKYSNFTLLLLAKAVIALIHQPLKTHLY